MNTSDFSFSLPDHLIAQHPAADRDGARLLHLDRESGRISHHLVRDLPQLLDPSAVMVFNDSRVRKARLIAEPAGRGPREFLLVRRSASGGFEEWSAMTSRSRQLRLGTPVTFPGGRQAEVAGRDGELVVLRFDAPLDEPYFAAHGHVPLPPYISRADETDDERRYQTVYAREPGSVAAPTAGLHFTEELLARLDERGIERTLVRLHVGIGTFLPVRVARVEDHVMHEEECEITQACADRINQARSAGRRILAVGTTSVRTLESAVDERTGLVRAFRGRTRLFITPGYRYRVVDALFTNFHTPESTLLMLVCAFAGREPVLDAYRTAVAHEYRFFSYGDAMLIT